MTRMFAAAVLGIAVSAIVLAWLQPVRGSELAVATAGEFCAAAPAEAHAGPQDVAAVALSTSVPMTDPPVPVESAMAPVAAMQGDVVRVTVDSSREGGVAVHGLLDVRPVPVRHPVTVEFRAIYSGRFPIHFHGADGSHIQIAAIEVMPRRTLSAQADAANPAQPSR